MNKILYGVLVFLLIFIIFSSVSAEQIKIKTVDGVKVVINPKSPVPPEGVPTKLILLEDFSIGDGEEEEEIFSEMYSIAVDNEGKIYILDRKESKIKVFNRKGNYVRTIGEQGQGPGEMNRPTGIQINPNNELVVEDNLNKRLVFFTLDGKFLKNVSTVKILSLVNVLIDSQGNIIGREFVFSANKFAWQVKKYDSDLNPLFTISSVDFVNPFGGEINPFRLLVLYELGKEDYIFYSNPEAYEIKILNPEGKLVKKILKEYKPVEITEKDKKELIEKISGISTGIKNRINFPKFYPAYQSFSLDEQGRIFVRTYEKGKKKGEYLFDIFDAEGRYIAKILLKGEPRIWKRKKLYAIEETEDGFHIFRCYSVRWEK